MLATCDEVEGTAMNRLAKHVRSSAHTQRSRRSSEAPKKARDERAREHAADEAKQAANETNLKVMRRTRPRHARAARSTANQRPPPPPPTQLRSCQALREQLAELTGKLQAAKALKVDAGVQVPPNPPPPSPSLPPLHPPLTLSATHTPSPSTPVASTRARGSGRRRCRSELGARAADR